MRYETMRPPKRSGLIPVYFDCGRIFACCMIPSNVKYGGDMPQMAKGHIEEVYTPKDNAIKEAQEELGLKMENIQEVFYLGDYTRISCYTCMVNDPDDFNEPHWESDAAIWVDITDSLNDVRDVQRDIFNDCLSFWSRRTMEH